MRGHREWWSNVRSLRILWVRSLFHYFSLFHPSMHPCIYPGGLDKVLTGHRLIFWENAQCACAHLLQHCIYPELCQVIHSVHQQLQILWRGEGSKRQSEMDGEMMISSESRDRKSAQGQEEEQQPDTTTIIIITGT